MRRGYSQIVAESFVSHEAGHRGEVHIRAIHGQLFPSDMYTECSDTLKNPNIFPVGTKFRLWVKTKQKELSRVHLYAYYGDNFEVLLNGVWVQVPAYGPFPKI